MNWTITPKSDSSNGAFNAGGFNFNPSKGLDEKKLLIGLGAAAAIFIAYKLLKKGRK